jgi:hypothetical protein
LDQDQESGRTVEGEAGGIDRTGSSNLGFAAAD